VSKTVPRSYCDISLQFVVTIGFSLWMGWSLTILQWWMSGG